MKRLLLDVALCALQVPVMGTVGRRDMDRQCHTECHFGRRKPGKYQTNPKIRDRGNDYNKQQFRVLTVTFMQCGKEMCSLVFDKCKNYPIQGFTKLLYIFATGKTRLVRARAHSGCKRIHTKGNLQEHCTISNAGIINDIGTISGSATFHISIF